MWAAVMTIGVTPGDVGRPESVRDFIRCDGSTIDAPWQLRCSSTLAELPKIAALPARLARNDGPRAELGGIAHWPQNSGGAIHREGETACGTEFLRLPRSPPPL